MNVWKLFAKKVKECGFTGQVYFNDEGGVDRFVLSVPLSAVKTIVVSRCKLKWLIRLDNGCKISYDGEERTLTVNDFEMVNVPTTLTIEDGELVLEVFNPER
mgnify:FL=1